MTIPKLEVIVAGTLADPTPINENFEKVRIAVNENTAKIIDSVDRIDTIEPQIMPDLNFEKTDSVFMVSNSKNSITLKKGTTIRLDISEEDVRYLEIKEDTSYNVFNLLDTGLSSFTQGKDYNIYIVQKDDIDSETEEIIKTVELKVSLNSTYPKDYNANNTRKIGGFHTLSIGVTSANAPHSTHPAIGYNAGDVIPNSVWCLSHRPQSEAAGMAYIDKRDKWVDIYKQGGKDGAPTSTFGATVADSRQQQNHQWDMLLCSKSLASDDDFTVFAEGSNQKTAIMGSASPVPKTTGGHVDTAGKRMISNYFIEECCGYMWEWLDEISANGGTAWATYDGSGSRGQTYGASYCLIAGGGWSDSASCGSRCRYANNARSIVGTNLGGRGVSLPLRV